MRACERRLARAFRRIVMMALAAPLAGAAACQAASSAASSDGGVIDADPCAPILIDGSALDTTADGCAAFRLLPCGLPGGAEVDSCSPDITSCKAACGGPVLFCQLAPGSCTNQGGALPDASVLLECNSCPGSGRRPRGLRERRPVDAPRGAGAGEYFAAAAYLESASVRAFRDLERWLVAFDAPARLVRAARRAAGEERSHARATRRLAGRFGGGCERPRMRRRPLPSLLEGLQDDAVTGCVGETFGALVATWQGENARDARVRRTMRRIAADETRHAALSWEILRWGLPRLGARDRSSVHAALEQALGCLVRGTPRRVSQAARRVSGHPSRAVEAALVESIARLVRDEALRAVC
jgi:hypothetical protein